MDLLKKVISDDIEGIDSKELAKLYDYDLFTLGDVADSLRQKYYGKKVFFNMNRHINPTNICADVCKFCAFSASRKNPNPYDMSIQQVVDECVSAYKRGAKEVHIVAAHHPHHEYKHYLDMFATIKQNTPFLHIKAMGAAEVDYLTRKFDLPLEQVLNDLAEAGVDSLPGGGAEIFDEKHLPESCQGHGTQTVCSESNKLATEYCSQYCEVKTETYGAVLPKEQLKLWTPVGRKVNDDYGRIYETCDIHTKPKEEPKPEEPTGNTITRPIETPDEEEPDEPEEPSTGGNTTGGETTPPEEPDTPETPTTPETRDKKKG